MKVFEFHFNPKAEKDRFVEVFSFEPQTAKEKERGSLYIVGELTHALPTNTSFLRQLALVIKNEYYASKKTAKKNPTPQVALKAALKKANQYLVAESKKGNVDWLGNLNVAVLSFLAVSPTKYQFYFTKTGSIEMLMGRDNTFLDIGEKVKSSQEETDALKVFSNVVSGKLEEHDRVVVVTQELHDALTKADMISPLAAFFEEKEFHGFFKRKEKETSKTTGVIFISVIDEPEKEPDTEEKPSVLEFRLSELSFPKIPQLFLPKIKKRALSAAPMIQTMQVRPSFIIKAKRNIIVVGLLVLVLLGGIFVFKGDGSNIKEIQAAIESAEAVRLQAESALLRDDKEQANRLFQKALAVIIDIEKNKNSLAEELLTLQSELEAQLRPLNNIVEVQEPAIAFEIPQDQQGFVAQTLFLFEKKLYVFDSSSLDYYTYDMAQNVKTIAQLPQKISQISSIGDTLIALGSSANFLSLGNSQEWKEGTLILTNEDVNLKGMAGFSNNIYFYDSAQGRIIKYTTPLQGLSAPTSWVNPSSTQKPVGAIGMAIDGNIWIMTDQREFQRYFTGLYKETLQPVVYPSLESVSLFKTGTNLLHLYLLDPEGKRVVLLSKNGKIVRQYHFPRATSLLDLAVSEDAKTIYVLDSYTVYQIPNEIEP